LLTLWVTRQQIAQKRQLRIPADVSLCKNPDKLFISKSG
jgi:hypothetical protein